MLSRVCILMLRTLQAAGMVAKETLHVHCEFVTAMNLIWSCGVKFPSFQGALTWKRGPTKVDINMLPL